MIVQNLADAASLEEALETEDDIEITDLYELVRNYVQNCNSVHSNRVFEYKGILGLPKSKLLTTVLEQLGQADRQCH